MQLSSPTRSCKSSRRIRENTTANHCSHNQSNNGMFPQGLIEETLSTLALLFPKGDKATQRWYATQDAHRPLDFKVLACEPHLRDIGDFQYWHDRLVTLLETLESPQNPSLRRMWNDRRNGMQWYSLWVAIGLTLFFGLVQSIEGGIQVYTALRSS